MWILAFVACLGARHEVDLADLAPLGSATLAELRDEEHAYTVARTMLEGAEADAERAEERLKRAREAADQARLEHRTAQAALEAARASGDVYRIGSAEGMEAAAKRERRRAEARVDWQVAAERAAQSAIEVAEARVELSEAELELARFELLAAADRAVGYRRSDFADQLEDAQAAYADAERAYEERVDAASRAWEDWRALEAGEGTRAAPEVRP